MNAPDLTRHESSRGTSIAQRDGMASGVVLMQHVNRIRFGFGAAGCLAEELAELGVRRPLLMTDAGVMRAGLAAPIVQALQGQVVATVFDACPATPAEPAVREALALYQRHGCDGLVALGGGAVIDLAKGVVLLASGEAPLSAYAAPAPSAVPGPSAPPLVAIPTTAGTGSEVGRGAGVELEGAARGEKSVFYSPRLVPRVALYDPGLTLSAPLSVAVSASVDALSHCIEGYLSPSINPPTEASALDGARRLAKYLPRLLEQPQDRQLRWELMMGALQGGLSMWKGLGFAHALSLPLEHAGLSHGVAAALVLPAAVRFATPACPEKVEALSEALGGDAADWLDQLNTTLGLNNQKALGLTPAQVAWMAEAATRSVFNQNAPRRAGVDDFAAVLRRLA